MKAKDYIFIIIIAALVLWIIFRPAKEVKNVKHLKALQTSYDSLEVVKKAQSISLDSAISKVKEIYTIHTRTIIRYKEFRKTENKPIEPLKVQALDSFFTKRYN